MSHLTGSDAITSTEWVAGSTRNRHRRHWLLSFPSRIIALVVFAGFGVAVAFMNSSMGSSPETTTTQPRQVFGAYASVEPAPADTMTPESSLPPSRSASKAPASAEATANAATLPTQTASPETPAPTAKSPAPPSPPAKSTPPTILPTAVWPPLVILPPVLEGTAAPTTPPAAASPSASTTPSATPSRSASSTPTPGTVLISASPSASVLAGVS